MPEKAKEQEEPNPALLQIIDEKIKLSPQSSDMQKISDIKAFGLNKELDNKWRFSYYIGLDYLDDTADYPVHVAPKFDNLNYLQMLEKCLQHPETARHIFRICDIRISKPFIETPPNDKSGFFIILIMYQFLKLLEELLKKPLIKSYITKKENLRHKIKGKVLLSEHIKKNIANRRHDRIMCGYNEYSVDCPANRLLHSAYKFCMESKAICENCRKISPETKIDFSNYSYLESCFRQIGYIEHHFETAKIKTNPLYPGYKDALHLAKIIYQHKSYNESSKPAREFRKIPPYIINMAILFELYVYSLFLDAGLDIYYQESGSSGIADFLLLDKELNKKLIIDTKYKKIYDSEARGSDMYRIEDIRQVSGYARDIRLLKKLYGKDERYWKTIVPKCLIIYPKMSHGNKFINKNELTKSPIKEFNEFYKYGVELPLLRNGS